MDRIEQLESALSIDYATSDAVRVDEARRLTGPGMLWNLPGAIIDVFFENEDADRVVQLWETHARRVLDALGWEDQQLTTRRFHGGVNLAISAPLDQLYSAVFAAQTAWHFCAATLLGTTPGDFGKMVGDVRKVAETEANPALITLINAANMHDVDILCDDDEVSIGHGFGCKTWPVDALPAPDQVDWSRHHDVPIVFVTGTNGKTTTTRLCAAIARAAGKVAGLTSTDFVRVGDDVLDYGDYSGPGGARMLLRDPRLEIACLEVARGGILRRGLATTRARAAVVTNVANDHLGQYGVNTVPELAQAKFSVHRALADDGVLILNADDAYVVAEAEQTPANIWWVSLDPHNPQIVGAKTSGQPCAFLNGEEVVFFDGETDQVVTHVLDIPIAMNGAAKYNISNALEALCVGKAMDLPDAAIRSGLSNFKPDPKDNPGRCNEFSSNGARVFVDFAHNPHSISAVCDALSSIPAKRRFIMLGHAGDRSDQDIHDVTLTAMRFNPDVVVAVELENYLRGREAGVIPELIKKAAIGAGMDPSQLRYATSPTKAVEMILAQIAPGDVALLLVLDEREEVFKMLGQGGK